jgi:hypothetical protein
MSPSIPTAQSLAAGSRRLDRRNALVAYVLAETRRGAILRRTHTPHGVWWTLNQQRISPDIAALVTRTRPSANDGLFTGTSQTFRSRRQK